MHIKALPVLRDNYIWVIINSAREALIVDPGVVQPVVDFIESEHLTLRAILATHKHGDHTDGIAGIQEVYPHVSVYGPLKDHVPLVDHDVQEGRDIVIPGFAPMQVLEIPGHTRGHVAYLNDNNLWCGDTLFAGGCGRVFDGTYAELFNSLLKIKALPVETQIYCAHEYTLSNLKFAVVVEPNNLDIQKRLQKVEALRAQAKITLPAKLAVELQTNPFLRLAQPEVRASAEKYTEHTLNNEFEVFKTLREWKNNF